MQDTAITNLQPQAIWQNFAQICAIPHPSGKEQQLVKFMQQFGEKLGLETIVDVANNVLIRKPATSGMEDHAAIILQGHLDMVPQKNKDTVHDFAKDPIQAYVAGEWVTAKGTTLGADNGAGVAIIMTVLQSKDIQHGPLEALFTVDEEAGMTGAIKFAAGVLKGKFLINLDTEDEKEICIGCAGGQYTDIKLKYSAEKVPDNMVAVAINITGLKGGHSGADIHLERGNANKILNRLLRKLAAKYAIRIAQIDAGGLHNAIPREAMAIVTVPQQHHKDLVKTATELQDMIKAELGKVDPDLKISVSDTEVPAKVMDKTMQQKLLDAVCACPNGVLNMSKDIPGLVDTSTNLARISAENGIIEILNLQRGSTESLKNEASNMVASAFALAGAEINIYGGYPGWKPKMDSQLLKMAQEIYRQKFQAKPHVHAIHAGLECGLLGHKYPDVEMISIGPTIMHAHSPDEKINIASVARSWEFLVALLKSL